MGKPLAGTCGAGGPMTACAPHFPTDLGNARRFVEQHGADLYMGPWGWLVCHDPGAGPP